MTAPLFVGLPGNETMTCALARMRGDDAMAGRLEAEASNLAERFEAAFWMEDEHYYAMALDRDKRQADAITSNPGQCLWSGIVAPERARDVMDRLTRPSLFSGWGIRTFATDQPGYNPIGYHTGTVWPHDTSLIAAGFKRYGFDEASNRLASQMMEAAQQFPDFRLPELFCGFDKDDAGSPVPYPVACSPQARSQPLCRPRGADGSGQDHDRTPPCEAARPGIRRCR